MPLAELSMDFQSFPPLPTSKLGPSGTDSQVGGVAYVGLSEEISCESGSFSCFLNPHRFFQSEVLRLSFPALEPWVAWSVSIPSCSSQFICTQMWDHQLSQLLPCLVCQPPSCCVSCLPSCLSLPLLPVWMNVSS